MEELPGYGNDTGGTDEKKKHGSDRCGSGADDLHC